MSFLKPSKAVHLLMMNYPRCDDELSEKVDMTEVAKYPTWLTRNMLGAALSHMGVYKRIVNSGTDWHLILEDDVVLETNINQAINLISDNSEMFRTHLIYVSYASDFVLWSITGGAGHTIKKSLTIR